MHTAIDAGVFIIMIGCLIVVIEFILPDDGDNDKYA